MAKEERQPYAKRIEGLDRTDEDQLTDQFNKEGDIRRAEFEKEIRNSTINYYTRFY
jgi:hypothetical protein